MGKPKSDDDDDVVGRVDDVVVAFRLKPVKLKAVELLLLLLVAMGAVVDDDDDDENEADDRQREREGVCDKS